ncbi:MAG: membrane protein insertase YidC [Bryobacterales bacterium]|nr:membrane protein insertase YidC [Bryobacterales bacterium]
MEQRLMLAFGLMGLVLIASTYLIPSSQSPVKQAPKGNPSSAQIPASQAPAQAKPAPDKSAPATAAARTAGEAARQVASKEETVQIETQVYKITFSNRGAVVHSWVLKKYTDSNGKPLELVNVNAVSKAGYPFQVRFHNDQSADVLNNGLWVAKLADDKQSIDFSYADGAWTGRKNFSFTGNSYLAHIKSEVSAGSTPKPHLLAWRGGFGDASVIGAAASQHSVRFDLSANKLQVLGASDLKGGAQAHRGRFSFAGIEDAYFAAVALPDTGKDFEIHSIGDNAPDAIDKKEQLNAGVAVGGDPVNSFQFFVGPKDTDLLKSISPRLTQLIDFGWFFFIAEPLFRAVHWMNDKYLHNYGWTIIVITVIINFLLLPLKMSSLKSMKKMSLLQPQIAAINEKYRGMSFKDPRKQEQNAEVMDLYKKHGVNPMGGCVPMVLQIPFFFAFYKVLSVAIEMRGADWLWVTDLSRPETLPIRILPVAMIASQFIMQKMTPSTTADPSQQRVMLLMPLFLGFMFYGVSSGLVLYWLTGNLVGIAQQWFFNKKFQGPVPAAPAVRKTKK